MNYDASHVERINDLLTSEGWQILSTWLHGRIQYHKDQLVICKLEEVETHRAQIKTYQSVLNKPRHIIDEVTEHTVDQHS